MLAAYRVIKTGFVKQYDAQSFIEYIQFFYRVCPFVGNGSPHPLSRMRMCLPLGPKGGWEQHSLAGKEVGDPIRTTGQKAWHSYTLWVLLNEHYWELKVNDQDRQLLNEFRKLSINQYYKTDSFS